MLFDTVRFHSGHKIIALEDEETKVRINFHNDKDIPMGTILTKEQMIHDLRPNKNYLVIIQDTRTVTEKDLTQDELKEIRRVFDEMDKDKSGSISFQEGRFLHRTISSDVYVFFL